MLTSLLPACLRVWSNRKSSCNFLLAVAACLAFGSVAQAQFYGDEHYNRGVDLFNAGRIREALACYTTAIRMDSRNTDAWTNRGACYHNLEDYESAIQDYSEALRRNPNDDVAWSGRAACQRELDQYEKAIQDFNQALRINPRNYDALDGLAWLKLTCPKAALRDTKGGYELACRAWYIDPNTEEICETFAAYYAAVGNFKKAIEFQKRAVAKAPQIEAYRDRLGMYERNKRSYEE